MHWHLGAEHYSVGQYDENGKGPNGNAKLEEHSDDPNTYHDGKNTTKAEATSTNGDAEEAVSTNAEDSAEAGAEEADTDEVDAEEASAQSSAPEETDAAEADADATEDEGASTAETVDEAVSTNATRRLADDYGSKEVRGGFRCHHYDPDDAKFTTEYEWKHCVNMEVGETYEVHWPHSAAGACGTVNQVRICRAYLVVRSRRLCISQLPHRSRSPDYVWCRLCAVPNALLRWRLLQPRPRHLPNLDSTECGLGSWRPGPGVHYRQ